MGGRTAPNQSRGSWLGEDVRLVRLVVTGVDMARGNRGRDYAVLTRVHCARRAGVVAAATKPGRPASAVACAARVRLRGQRLRTPGSCELGLGARLASWIWLPGLCRCWPSFR